jgi:hypothetical protein
MNDARVCAHVTIYHNTESIDLTKGQRAEVGIKRVILKEGNGFDRKIKYVPRRMRCDGCNREKKPILLDDNVFDCFEAVRARHRHSRQIRRFSLRATVYTAMTVYWVDHHVGSIEFQSDLAPHLMEIPLRKVNLRSIRSGRSI